MQDAQNTVISEQSGNEVVYEIGEEVSIEMLSKNTGISPSTLISKFAIIPAFTGVAVAATVFLTVELLEMLWKR